MLYEVITDKASGSSVPFDIAEVHFEQNVTDGDVEVVFEVNAGDEAVAQCLDPHQPGFGPLLGCRGAPVSVDIEPSMRARSDAGIFLRAPVDESYNFV